MKSIKLILAGWTPCINGRRIQWRKRYPNDHFGFIQYQCSAKGALYIESRRKEFAS